MTDTTIFTVGFLLLGMLTAAVAATTLVVWRATRSPHFVIGLALIYYYSLFGAWKILELRMTGGSDDSLAYLEASLFPVMVDENYLLSIALYGVFNLALACSIVALGHRPHSDQPTRFDVSQLCATAIAPAHAWLGFISLLCLAASLAIEWQGIRAALESDVSAYSITRGEPSPLYSLHLLLNRIGLAALAIGVSTWFAIKRAGRTALACYGIVGLAWMLFLIVIGNRNELLMAGIAGTLWYCTLGGRLPLSRSLALGFLAFAALRFIEATRDSGVESLLTDVGTVLLSAEFWDPLALATGSESLAAHMSLYGILANDLDLTYGSSLLYLLVSVLPQIVFSDRPPDIYSIYAAGVSAVDSQGFNIHYAAGWYLNFGLAGILVGAMIVAATWTSLLRLASNAASSPRLRAAWACALCFAAAFAPAMMRNGPEGLKALLIEAIAIPFGLTWLALRTAAIADDGRRGGGR